MIKLEPKRSRHWGWKRFICVGPIVLFLTQSYPVCAEEVEVLRVKNCTIAPIADIRVPAKEAGVLVRLDVKAGQAVIAGKTILGSIDSEQIEIQQKGAELELASAKMKAENTTSIEFAVASARVSQAEIDVAAVANKRVPGSITESEMRRRVLAKEKDDAGVRQAKSDISLAQLTAQFKQSEADAAALGVRRRKIVTPVDGVVAELLRSEGEWVQPGDAVCRVVKMSRLRAEGYISADKFAPHEIAGRSVVLKIQLARGKSVELPASVQFVSPVIESSGEYRIWCEFDNPQAGEHWIVRPGMIAEMVVDLKSPQITEAAAGSNQKRVD